MALTAQTRWVFSASGDDDNGAGWYDRGGASANYANQDAAELDLTDLATPGAGNTTLTSATGGFTAAMVGSVWYIKSGANFTAGYYEMTAYTNGNTCTLDRSPTPGGAGSGGNGRLGGARQTITDAFFSSPMQQYDSAYFQNGTFTLAENISIPDVYMRLFGFDAYADIDDPDDAQVRYGPANYPLGTDRPLIIAGSYSFQVGDEKWYYHIRMETANANGLEHKTDCSFFNVQVVSSNSTANSRGFSGTGDSTFLACEAINTARGQTGSQGFFGGGIKHRFCRAIGWGTGINGQSYGNCIAESCFNGIAVQGHDHNVNHCVLFNCAIGMNVNGLSGTTYDRYWIINNQFVSCYEYGFYADNWLFYMIMNYNNWYNNDANWGNGVASIGTNDTEVDPGFADASVVSGATATTSGAVLTDGGADFSGVTDDDTWVILAAGTGITSGVYMITGHTGTSLTLAVAPGDSVAGDIEYYVGIGHDYSGVDTADGLDMGYAVGA